MLLIKNALIGENKKVDLLVENGKIAKVEENIADMADEVMDLEGKVLIPGLIESHIHLDKALIADRKPNGSGTLEEAIKVTAELKPTFSAEDIYDRSTKIVETLIQNGVTHIRTHSEFDPEQGFTGLEQVLKIKEEYKDIVDIQVVAFPQEGIFKTVGVEKMMEEAMEMGADVVGAIPYNDRDPKEHIDFVFELAKKYDKDLDFHQDFKDDAGAISIEYLAKKTIEEGYQGRVSVGHLTALGAVEPERLDGIIQLMKEAGISVMSLPATDLHLGGRRDDYNVRRTLTPIRKLRDAGVNMCISTNNIRNAFTPYGNGDIFVTAMLAIAAGHLGGADDLPTVLPMLTYNPAKALGLKNYGLNVGDNADFVVLNTCKYQDSIIDIPARLFVFKNGKIVAKTEVSKELIRG